MIPKIHSEYYSKFKDTEFKLTPSYKEELDPYGDEWSNEPRTSEKINEWKRVYYAMTANLDMNIGRLQNDGACAAWENGHEWRALREKAVHICIFL